MNSVLVHYTNCGCEWESKFCHEFHTITARVPIEILNEYEIQTIPDDEED